MRICLFFVFFLSVKVSLSQDTYRDSVEAYFKQYIRDHEVVTGNNKNLITFYPADEKYRIRCRFEKTVNSPWFKMETSGPVKKLQDLWHYSFYNK